MPPDLLEIRRRTEPPPGEPSLEMSIYCALRRAIFLVVGLYLLFEFLEGVTFIVLFFALVLLLAAILNPIVAWLQRHHIPRPLSAILLGLLIFGALGAAVWYGVPPLIEQGREFADNLPTLWSDLRDRLQTFLNDYPELARQLPTAQELVARFGPTVSNLLGQLALYTRDLFTVLVSLLLLIVLVIYCLASPQPLIAGLLGAFPERQRSQAEHLLQEILHKLKGWALGSLLLGAIVGVMTWVGLHFLGIPFALVFAVIAAIGELIPTLGPLLSAIPPILVALAVDPIQAVWVALLFLAIQQIENNLVAPLVLANAVDVHPVSVTFAVLVMGSIFGVLGALIAVPTIVIIKTLYQELYQRRQVQDPESLEKESRRIANEAEPGSASQTADSPEGGPAPKQRGSESTDEERSRSRGAGLNDR